MKHTLKVTLFLLVIFFTAQIVGLFLVSETIYPQMDDKGEIATDNTGNIVIEYDLDSEPPFETSGNLTYLVVMIFVGTALVLLMNRFKLFKVWKAWFFVATLYLLTIAFGAFFDEKIAFMVAVFFVLLRTFRLSVISHNFVELFVYAGIPVIFAPILSMVSVSVVLIFIAIYDMIAVWKTKHMVKRKINFYIKI